MNGAIRKRRILQSALAVGGVLGAGQALAVAFGPVDMSGHLGYYYRSVADESGQDDNSHQLGGALNIYTYLGAPWLATTNLALNVTQDSSESSGGDVEESTDSQLITGDLALNVLPSSRTPFVLQLQTTDSRVDSERTGSTPITYVGEEYSTTYLGLKQSYITGNGGRFQLSYDTRSWESDAGGEFEDDTARFEADLRAPRQHFIGRASVQNNDNLTTEMNNGSQIIDLSHFYYPLRHFRLDTKASFYEYEREFIDPSATDTRLSNLDVTQVSTNAFWRPQNYPLSMNAGLRVYSMDGMQGDVAGNEISQVAFNSGLFFNASQNIRFDASVASTFGESGGEEDSVHRQQFGVLFQSNWAEFAGFMYQAYLDGDFKHSIDALKDEYGVAASAGHGLGRTWWGPERVSNTSFRVNLTQTLSAHAALGTVDITIAGTPLEDEGFTDQGVRLDHAATMAFNQQVWGGNTLAQLIVSDTRDYAATDYDESFEDTALEQQLVNFQLSRDQDLGRRSSITGDITVQYVRQRGESDTGVAEKVTDVREVTTSTGRLMFSHHQLFGVPRLQFSSDYMVSKISTEGAIDRQDWSNRLSYMIGKLDASLSYRLTETDSRNYDLFYFRVMRRF